MAQAGLYRLMVSTTAVRFRCQAFFTGMKQPVTALRPILILFRLDFIGFPP